MCGRARDILDQRKVAGTDAVPALMCLAEAQLPTAPRQAIATAKRAHSLATATSAAPVTALLLARCQIAAGDRRAATATINAVRAAATGEVRIKLDALLRTHGPR